MDQRLSKKLNKETWEASTVVLEALKEHFSEDLEALERKTYSVDSYGIPSWSEYQADLLGSIRTLKKVISILTMEK